MVTTFFTLLTKNAAVAPFTTRRLGTNAVVQSTTTLPIINVVILIISYPVRSLVQFIDTLSGLCAYILFILK